MTDANEPAAIAGRKGPLSGLRVVEFASIGPGPHCGMLLSDLGAEVLRIERQGGNGWRNPVADRGRSVLQLDIRTEEGREFCLRAAAKADVVIEGLRPGVMERLGLGPEALLGANPQLIYGRMTGWGQTGLLAKTAGHDINYIALTGALAAIGGESDVSVPPLNLVGDFGGGSTFLMIGILAALYERGRSGKGQVVDAAILDGVASLMGFFTGLAPSGHISLDRDRNVLGGAAHFYRCYECADGREVAVGAIEPQFYAELLDRIGAPADLREKQHEQSLWKERSAALGAIFKTKTSEQWREIFEGGDACFAPVLTLDESMRDPHMIERGAYVDIDGVRQPAPAPRFSRTPGEIAKAPDGAALLRLWGVNEAL